MLRLEEVEVVREGQPFGHCMDVPIAAHALVELTDISVTMVEDLAEVTA